MSGNELVEKLLRGSRNIDQMREEIRTIVAILLGLILKAPEDYERHGSRLKGLNASSEWVFKGEGSFQWHVLYQGSRGIRASAVFPGEGRICLYTQWGGSTEGMDTVATLCIHRELPTLVTKMVETFPELKKNLEPFLAAAEVKL